VVQGQLQGQGGAAGAQLVEAVLATVLVVRGRRSRPRGRPIASERIWRAGQRFRPRLAEGAGAGGAQLVVTVVTEVTSPAAGRLRSNTGISVVWDAAGALLLGLVVVVVVLATVVGRQGLHPVRARAAANRAGRRATAGLSRAGRRCWLVAPGTSTRCGPGSRCRRARRAVLLAAL